MSRDDVTVVIVADGCGSQKYSEVGALVGVNVVANTVLNFGLGLKQLQSWNDVRYSLIEQLRIMFRVVAYGDEGPTPEKTWAAFVLDHLLFTIVGALITPETTTFFGIGDGVIIANGEDVLTEKPAGNAPSYLAYALLNSSTNTRIEIHREMPTVELEHFLLGSDGLLDLRKAAEAPVPNGAGIVGPLSQFWTEDRFFKNPDMVRRRLRLINGGVDAGPKDGLLTDDTTLVVGRRIVTDGTVP